MQNQPTRKRTEITIETRSVTIIRSSNAPAPPVYCPHCQAQVAVFGAAQAAQILGAEASKIERLLQLGLIHRAGELAFCGPSLTAHWQQEIRPNDG